jgi:hypothetical protein
MAFVPEGQVDSSQARSAFLQFAFGEGELGMIYVPKVATGLSPGFNPGNPQNNEFALTRHMNVRSMNNTRSSELEMLKGREADLIKPAPIAAPKNRVRN